MNSTKIVDETPSELRFNGWPLVPLLAILIILYLVSPSTTWLTLILALGLTLLTGWLWAKQMQKHVSLTREKRYTWTRVGDRLEERFTLNNTGLLPVLWVEVDDYSNVPGYHPDRATGVDSNNFQRWTAVGVCRHRGVFNLGPTGLRMGDPFGLFAVFKHNPATVPLLVLPPVLELPGIQVAPGGQVSEGRPRPYAPQPTILATSVRQYGPGDSLRMIHWPITAHRDSLFVRTFDGSPSGNWWIILDLAADVHHGEGDDSTLEQGITLAASLLENGLHAGQSVGLIGHSAEPVWLPPARDDAQRWTVLRELATIKAGHYPLASLLHHAGATLDRSASVIVITPSTDPVWLEPLLLLQKRDLIPTVMLLPGERKLSEITLLHELLVQQGITTYVLEPEILKPAIDLAKAQGEWEWHTTALGRAVAVHQPQGEWEVVQ
ncbi:MAG: DUF58 domain-containing protein [Anaerolineae bacterium]|nr:DUF58 domain-containing protein [Anaerolineae bacterium]